MGGIGHRLLGALVVASIVACSTEAPTPNRTFTLNENMIEGLAVGALDTACDYAEVLPQLLAQIGPDADVYPSENYYYFSFNRAGSSFSGSLRLASDRRDSGVLDYMCYQSYRSWVPPGDEIRAYQHLSAADGVVVEKRSTGVYRVAFDGAETLFALHQLDHTKPSDSLLPGDQFIGRLQDESGAAFELIYNEDINEFYFLADLDASVPEAFSNPAPDVLVSRRTGFVYYHPADSDRYLLVAVNSREVALNTFFDGPFDHLPENDFAALNFWDYVYKVYPALEGNHTPGGTVDDDGMIFSIRPYRHYSVVGDLSFVSACTQTRQTELDRLTCLIWGL